MGKSSRARPISSSEEKAAPASRKRKRQEKLQHYGVDLPEITGVPVQVIPLLVNALKVATKYFQHEDRVAYNDDWASNNHGEHTEVAVAQTTQARNQTGTRVLDNLLDRLDSTLPTSQEDQQQENRKTKMKDTIQSWLQAVKRNLSSSGPAVSSSENASHNGSSVPLSCLLYIWSMAEEHKRLAVRRAALLLARHLLDRSADCRRVLLQENAEELLWKWMNIVSEGEAGFHHSKQRLWRREACFLLAHLKRQNYGDLYPKLTVAERYLREACALQVEVVQGGKHESDEYSNNYFSMAALRNLRDIALNHGSEEIKRVNRLIQRAKSCLDILVPRLGEEKEDPEIQQKSRHVADLGDGGQIDSVFGFGEAVNVETEDDNIDWEDGWDNSDNESHEDEDGLKADSHSEAVERTLLAMESMGGIFKTGGLEINYKAPDPDPLVSVDALAPPNPKLLEARSRLAKCVRILSERHMRRIRLWLEGLTNADRLYAPGEQLSSLIIMPAEKSRSREELQRTCSDLKSQILIVLESAARLGIRSDTSSK